MALRDWINPTYLDDNKVADLKEEYNAGHPFANITLPDFFDEQKLADVIVALSSEEFEHKEADLFKFSQTKDLVSSSNELITEFRRFLCSAEFANFLTKLTGVTVKSGGIDMAGTLYGDTDFLLCHDDEIEGRSLAFMIYLSSLDKADGGELSLYESIDSKPTTIAKQIIPQANTFAFFTVTPTSFHRVNEIVRDTQRVTISGWFHG